MSSVYTILRIIGPELEAWVDDNACVHGVIEPESTMTKHLPYTSCYVKFLESIQLENIQSRTVRTGKSASFTCTVVNGIAIEFLWLKEGQLIRQNEKYRITSHPENSFLTIRNVNPKDAGSYMCVAKNSFSEDRRSATLRVEGIH